MSKLGGVFIASRPARCDLHFAFGVLGGEGLAFGDEEAVVDDARDLADGLGEAFQGGGGLGDVCGDGQVEDVPGVVGDGGLGEGVGGGGGRGLGSAEWVWVFGGWDEAQLGEVAEDADACEGDDLDGEEAFFAQVFGELCVVDEVDG